MMNDTDLGYYVYLFRNPEDNRIFYVGKGTGPRAINLNGRNQKTIAQIEEIRKKQRTDPIIELLRYGLDEKTALMYEGLAIDVIGIENLTNINNGQRDTPITWPSKPDKSTRQLPDPINEAKIIEPSIIIRVNQLYRSGMNREELYEITRGIWPMSERRKKAEYAFAAFQGIILDVYKIKDWYPAGKTTYHTRPNITRDQLSPDRLRRWEFLEDLDKPIKDEIREKYRLKSVKSYFTSRFPITYVNC
jgi:hypothetical protein